MSGFAKWVETNPIFGITASLTGLGAGLVSAAEGASLILGLAGASMGALAGYYTWRIKRRHWKHLEATATLETRAQLESREKAEKREQFEAREQLMIREELNFREQQGARRRLEAREQLEARVISGEMACPFAGHAECPLGRLTKENKKDSV